MGNKILGKRSRSFYKGFNERQISYIKQKFSSMSINGILDKELFSEAYKLNKKITSQFYLFVDFDSNSQIDQYEFICAVHTFCNMTINELSSQLFQMLIMDKKQQSNEINQKQLLSFTEICLKYNSYLQRGQITDKQISKSNKDKFKKYDYDKNKSINKQEFIKICSKDQDYKKWLFNMGFITKNQMKFHDQIYDLIDSDIEAEIEKHLNQTNPNIDKIKRGIEHRIDDDQYQVEIQVGLQSLPGNNQKNNQSKVQQSKQQWEKQIKSVQNDKKFNLIQKDKQNPATPSQSLTISYVFGYRSFDCRNNLKFDKDNNVIYHQGNLGIVMKIKDKKLNNFQQKYINQHKDDIVCLEVVDNLAITGELGSKPSIIIWQTNQIPQKVDGDKGQNLKPKMIITDQLIDSIANITMCNNKKMIGVSCNNSEHRLVIFNFDQLKQIEKDLTSTKTGIIAYGNLGKNVILDIKFTLNSKYIVAATLKELIFVSFQNSNLKTNRGEFNNFSNSPSLCLLPLETKEKKYYLLTGMANGSVYFWENLKCVKAVCGHTGSVSALGLRNDVSAFISGDKTGKIILWSQKLQKQLILNVTKTNSPSNMIISLSMNNKKQLLVGTKSSKAYIVSLSKSNSKGQINEQDCIITGHSQGHIRALAVDQRQDNNYFYTGGEDQRLIKWHYGSCNKLLLQRKLPYAIRSLDFNNHHLKKYLAVGYKNGVIELFNQNIQPKGSTFNEIKNPDQQTLIFIKISPDSQFLIASYSYQYKSVSKQFTQKNCLKIFSLKGEKLKEIKQIQQKNKIIAADISNDNQYIRLNTSNYEYFVYDVKDKPTKLSMNEIKQVIKRMKQEKQRNPSKERYLWANIWSTHSCFMSPQTQGFKTQGVSQSDILCCQRIRKHGNVFLIGDRFSKIKLFNYPCKTYPLFNKYTGHSNEVTALQFNKKQDYLISVGGEEKSIIVWKYDPDEVNNKQFYDQIQQIEIDENEQLVQQKAQGQQSSGNSALRIPKIPKGQIKQPTNFKYNPKKDNILPDQNVQIYHVFGLRNKYLNDQIRNQCKFTADFKHIVFPTACLGVKMEISEERNQTFFNQHKEDIVSFAVDEKRKLMATGQMAEKNTQDPKKKILSIYIWDIENNKMLKKLGGFHTIAVVALSFSPSSKLLFSVGHDKANSYAIWDWKAATILYSGPVSNSKVNGICWKSESQFMTVGDDHVKIWTQGKGKQQKFPQDCKNQIMLSCAVFKTTYISGSDKGKIFDWNLRKAIPAHKGKVQTIFTSGDNFYSGGADGIILIWEKSKNGLSSKQMVKIQDIFPKIDKTFDNINKQQFSTFYGVLSIDMSKDNYFLVATNGADVLYFKQSSKQRPKILHSGHCSEQLWGLTTVADSNLMITGGDDKTVRLWDIQNKKQLYRIKMQQRIRGLDWYDDKVVIADDKATIHLYDSTLQKYLYTHQGRPFNNNQKEKTNKPFVEDIKFSPDGKYIVYGTHGKSIWYELLTINQKNQLKTIKNIKGGTSALLHIDWAKDSSMFAVNTQSYQYRFHGVRGGEPSASSTRDQQWATWTRKIGFQSLGVFQGVDLTDVNTVCRHPSKTFLAAGYDDQTIKLYRYPTYIYKQIHKTFYGHSSHVTRVRFSRQYMISTGGNDRTIIIWKFDQKQQNEQKSNKMIKNKNNQSQYTDDSDGIDDIEEDVDLPSKAIMKKKIIKNNQDFYEVLDEGDEFMAIKPWLGAIRQPSYLFPKTGLQPPKSISLKLQHVFGYRSKDCRQNLFYYQNGVLLFHAAAVLIFHDIEKNKQTLLTNHNDDILSIDYNKNKERIVTGELGPKPLLCLYEKGKIKQIFNAPVLKGIITVAISPSGNLAACVGIDEDHCVSVIDLDGKGGILHQKVKSTRKIITKIKWISQKQFITIGINTFILWNFSNNRIQKYKQSKQNGNFISIDIQDDLVLTGSGNGTLIQWIGSNIKQKFSLQNKQKVKEQRVKMKKQRQSQQQNKKNKKLQQKQQRKNDKNTTYEDDQGDEDEQYRKNQQKDEDNLKISAGLIQCIRITKDFVACGTREGEIYFLDKKNLSTALKIIDMSFLLSIDNDKIEQKDISFNPAIRSIDFWGTKMVIGTLASEIYQMQINNKFQINWSTFRNVTKGHYSPNSLWTNEVWGLTVVGDKIFTCSDDATIRYWSLKQKKLKFSISLLGKDEQEQNLKQTKNQNMNQKKSLQNIPQALRLRIIAVSPLQKYIVVGSKDGTINVFQFDSTKIDEPIRSRPFKTFKPSTEQISQIKFAYKTLIIGSHDNAIYVYDFEEESQHEKGKNNQKVCIIKRRFKPMKKHSSYITHFDVSRDSCFLQSTCGAYELLYWDLNSGAQLTSGATLLKDERWASWTCNLGWPVQGIYPKYTDGTFINSVDRSNYSIKGQKWQSDQKNQKDFYLLVVGNDNGKVCVYNYPSLVKNSGFIQGKGHSSHVTHVKWSEQDDYIVSTGGQDQCVMIWKVENSNRK